MNSTGYDKGDLVCVFVWGVLAAGLPMMIVASCIENGLKAEAMKAGVAEYQCDPKTGETKFVFKREAAKP